MVALSASTSITVKGGMALLHPPLVMTPRYLTFVIKDAIYIANTWMTRMPQAFMLPPIDASDGVPAQEQTITLDFGAGYLPDGVFLVGVPTVVLSVSWGNDLFPSSRILVPPRIGTAPSPYGSGRENCAVLFQIGQCPGPLTYLIKCSCARSDDDVATMDTLLHVRVPGQD